MSPLAIFTGPYGMLAKWGVIAALALACMGFGAAKMHQHDVKAYDALTAEYSGFRAQVKTLGEQAERERAAHVAADKQRKEDADAENARTTAALAADVKRLRDARAGPGGSFLPAAAPGSASPDRACFDRTLLEQAIRGLDLGVQGLVDEGSKAVIDLNTAKAWARP